MGWGDCTWVVRSAGARVTPVVGRPCEPKAPDSCCKTRNDGQAPRASPERPLPSSSCSSSPRAVSGDSRASLEASDMSLDVGTGNTAGRVSDMGKGLGVPMVQLLLSLARRTGVGGLLCPTPPPLPPLRLSLSCGFSVLTRRLGDAMGHSRCHGRCPSVVSAGEVGGGGR
jgi:hypothetical protein